MCMMAIGASAQIKTIDVMGDLRGDGGIGAGITLGVTDKIDIAPRFNYYFCKGDATMFTIDADFHYDFKLADEWKIYPIVGAAFLHSGGKNIDGESRLGVNLGIGGQYTLTEKIGIFLEGKYQWVNHYDDTYFTLGVNIGI